jgi:hypothetical protein
VLSAACVPYSHYRMPDSEREGDRETDAHIPIETADRGFQDHEENKPDRNGIKEREQIEPARFHVIPLAYLPIHRNGPGRRLLSPSSIELTTAPV